MSRTYIKIFLIFWLVTILMLVGSSIVVHFFGLAPERHITHSDADPMSGPSGRLLREFVSDAVNNDFERVKSGFETIPSWATQYLYVIDKNGNDLLERPIPEKIRLFLPNINATTPLSQSTQNKDNMYGRFFTLSDGTPITLVVQSPNNALLRWKLYFHNIWHFLVLSILISGAACYYLARYMTRDIQTLKTATQQIARGNLDTRVAKELCNRPGEMGELGRAFDNMAVKLQQTMLEQRRLIKDVSHELRSPLARLQVALAIAQQRANSEIKDELERIKRAADYLNDVISNILSLPLTDQDTWELNDVVEICSLLSVIVDACSVEAKGKNVSLILHDNLKESLIQTRSNTLVGVFDNVIRNAIRYTANDSPVGIFLSQATDGFCEIRICDRGPGVNKDQLEAIFEPFFRTDEARCRKKGGYGLGLAIAKRTVDLHGGSIKAEINSKGGLSVSIRLPQCDDTVCLISDRSEASDRQDSADHYRS